MNEELRKASETGANGGSPSEQGRQPYVGFHSVMDGDTSIAFDVDVNGHDIIRAPMFEDGNSFVGYGSESVGGVGAGGSVVSALWSAASQFNNHPLKLLLADSQQEGVYYLPPKKKDQAQTMQRKIDAQRAAASRARANQQMQTTKKVSAAKRVDALVRKAVPKGRDAEISRRLLSQYSGLGGARARELLYADIEAKKQAARRARILARNPHAFDPPPPAPTSEDEKEEEIEEPLIDSRVYGDDLWADSGPSFVRSEANKAIRRVLVQKRWVAIVTAFRMPVRLAPALGSALTQRQTQRAAVAHLWGSDKAMHAVLAIQRAYFRFRRLRYNDDGSSTRQQQRKEHLLDGSLQHSSVEGTYEGRTEVHRKRVVSLSQITIFLKDVQRCLSFKLTILRFVRLMKRLQSNIRCHLRVNAARFDALTVMFDRAIGPLLNHIHVVDLGNGLDTPGLNRAEQAAVLRPLNAGVSKGTRGLRVVKEMRSPAFHRLLRSYHYDEHDVDGSRGRQGKVHDEQMSLHAVSYQAKIAQGRYMTNDPAGGTLIAPEVRKRVLERFIMRRRTDFVKRLTHRLLYQGLEGAGHSQAQGQGSANEFVNAELVRTFLNSSPSSADVVALEVESRMAIADAAKMSYALQRRKRQNNLTCQTIWSDFLPQVTAADLAALLFEMASITLREKLQRDTKAEREQYCTLHGPSGECSEFFFHGTCRHSTIHIHMAQSPTAKRKKEREVKYSERWGKPVPPKAPKPSAMRTAGAAAVSAPRKTRQVSISSSAN
jgi:hypothetical protein